MCHMIPPSESPTRSQFIIWREEITKMCSRLWICQMFCRSLALQCRRLATNVGRLILRHSPGVVVGFASLIIEQKPAMEMKRIFANKVDLAFWWETFSLLLFSLSIECRADDFSARSRSPFSAVDKIALRNNFFFISDFADFSIFIFSLSRLVCQRFVIPRRGREEEKFLKFFVKLIRVGGLGEKWNEHTRVVKQTKR